MGTDLGSTTVTSDGVAYNARTRLRAVSLVHGSTGGTVLFKDGGASGTTLLSLATPASADSLTLPLPENGILFESNIHVTVDDATSVTVVYG